jgi:hypothetical protein
MQKNCSNCISDKERKRGSINCVKCVQESAWRPGVMVTCKDCAFLITYKAMCGIHLELVGVGDGQGCWDGWRKELVEVEKENE